MSSEAAGDLETLRIQLRDDSFLGDVISLTCGLSVEFDHAGMLAGSSEVSSAPVASGRVGCQVGSARVTLASLRAVGPPRLRRSRDWQEARSKRDYPGELEGRGPLDRPFHHRR